MQQRSERALQEHILRHHELPHVVRLHRPGWWRQGQTIARLLTHEEIAYVSTPYAAPGTAAAALVEDEPSGSTAKRQKRPRRSHRARLVPRHVPLVEDRAAMGHAALLGSCAPRCSTGSTQTLFTAGNEAHQQKHRLAGELCCHPQT